MHCNLIRITDYRSSHYYHHRIRSSVISWLWLPLTIIIIIILTPTCKTTILSFHINPTFYHHRIYKSSNTFVKFSNNNNNNYYRVNKYSDNKKRLYYTERISTFRSLSDNNLRSKMLLASSSEVISSTLPFHDDDYDESSYDMNQKKKNTMSQQNHCDNDANDANGVIKRTIQNDQEKEEKLQKWRQVVSDFEQQVLDPLYIAGPIRSSTIEAAAMYRTITSSLNENSNIDSIPQHNNYVMPGSRKHLGGAYDPTDGCIYGVPANSKAILCLYPVDEDGNKVITNHKQRNENDNIVHHYEVKAIPLPEIVHSYPTKFLRGIIANGYLWAIPSWANCVLCFDVDLYWGRKQRDNDDNNDDAVQLIDLPKEHQLQQWQWHGAGINYNKTAIYCIPSNAQHVLKVDIINKVTSLIPITGCKPDILQLTNKWYGGIIGIDNCVYGIPYRANCILQIQCNTDTAIVIPTPNNYETSQYYWHGGIKVNGIIYAHPSHSNTVLAINTNLSNNHPEKVTELPIDCYDPTMTTIDHDHDHDNDDRITTTNNMKRYQWLGGCVGIDGNIYHPACDTNTVLKINIQTNYCSTFGFCGITKNKWQGGVLGRDGCIYCIPANGPNILRIATTPDNTDDTDIIFTSIRDRVQLIGNDIIPNHKDKWQGGYQGLDGCLYFIPENGYRILKIIPPKQLSLLNGKLRNDDYQIIML